MASRFSPPGFPLTHSGRRGEDSRANCWGQSYAHDRYANLTNISSTQCGSPTMTVTVDSKNQIANSGFAYDSAGNLTSDSTYTYTWDAENHLTSANGVTYAYDGGGKRVKKSNGTLYWYDVSGEVIEETDLTGNVQNDYVFLRGERVAKRDTTGAVYLYLKDVVGSTAMLTDANANVKNSSDFYPFGGERVITSTVASNYKFTGLERDSETGLDHTLFRQYSSSMGRWLSPDPICKGCTNPQKLNRYQYALNNPVTLTDPLGLDPVFSGGGEPPPPAPPLFCSINGQGFVGELCELLFPFSSASIADPDLLELRKDKPDKNQLTVTNASKSGPNQDLITETMKSVLDFLGGDADCYEFLASKGVKPGELLESIYFGGLYGHADVSLNDDPNIVTAFVGGKEPAGQAITFNNQGAFYLPSTTAQSRGLTLLHELGHLTGVLGPDLGNVKASARNDQAIEDHCKETLNSLN